MKTNMNAHFIFLLTALVMLLTSCSNMISVEKRKYRKGFYIEHAAKRPSTNANAIPVVAETNRPEPSRVLNQYKEDSLPKENVYVKENVSRSKIDAPVKSKNEIVPAVSKMKTKNVLPAFKKKTTGAPSLFPVKSKKQTPVKSSQADEAAGVVIFFVVAASFVLALFVLGFAAIYLVVAGLVILVAPVVLIGLLVIAAIDVLIIRAVLK
jgi:hypothetical protein